MTLPPSELRRARVLLSVFIVGLVVSGLTAIPLETEINLLTRWLSEGRSAGEGGLIGWILKVREGLVATNVHYPFLAYGTDWLAFGHVAIAVSFLGPWRDPVKNLWVIEFGMIACVMVIPWAMIFGSLRGIPFGWRLIDCSFGVFGILPLWWCRKLVRKASPGNWSGPEARSRAGALTAR